MQINYFVLFHFIMKTVLSILFTQSNYNHLSSIKCLAQCWNWLQQTTYIARTTEI